MNGKFWDIKAGQLKEGEECSFGCPHKDDADLSAKYNEGSTVRRLLTLESDHPKESPLYEPFPSARWCVIIKA